MKLLITVVFFVITNTILIAQNTTGNNLEEKRCSSPDAVIPYKEISKANTGTEQTERKHPSKEEITSQKIAFFSQELNLTPQEAEKFWPIYNASWHARGRARRETMNNLNKLNQALEANPPVSDTQIQALSDTYIQSYKKEGDLYISYFNDFKKVLPLRKAVKVFSAEEKFRVVLIKQLRGK